MSAHVAKQDMSGVFYKKSNGVEEEKVLEADSAAPTGKPPKGKPDMAIDIKTV